MKKATYSSKYFCLVIHCYWNNFFVTHKMFQFSAFSSDSLGQKALISLESEPLHSVLDSFPNFPENSSWLGWFMGLFFKANPVRMKLEFRKAVLITLCAFLRREGITAKKVVQKFHHLGDIPPYPKKLELPILTNKQQYYCSPNKTICRLSTVMTQIVNLS